MGFEKVEGKGAGEKSIAEQILDYQKVIAREVLMMNNLLKDTLVELNRKRQ